MKRYLVQPSDGIFVKGYGVSSFTKDMVTNIGNNISYILSSKYSPGLLAACQEILDRVKQSGTVALKTASKTAIRKKAGATGDLIGNKISDKITRVPKKTSLKIIQKEMKKNT